MHEKIAGEITRRATVLLDAATLQPLARSGRGAARAAVELRARVRFVRRELLPLSPRSVARHRHHVRSGQPVHAAAGQLLVLDRLGGAAAQPALRSDRRAAPAGPDLARLGGVDRPEPRRRSRPHPGRLSALHRLQPPARGAASIERRIRGEPTARVTCRSARSRARRRPRARVRRRQALPAGRLCTAGKRAPSQVEGRQARQPRPIALRRGARALADDERRSRHPPRRGAARPLPLLPGTGRPHPGPLQRQQQLPAGLRLVQRTCSLADRPPRVRPAARLSGPLRTLHRRRRQRRTLRVASGRRLLRPDVELRLVLSGVRAVRVPQRVRGSRPTPRRAATRTPDAAW